MANLCLLPWYGGKQKSLNWLYSNFPQESMYKCFVDVFGGAGNVILNVKHNNKHNIYNDLNVGTTNLFSVLKDKAKAGELQRLLKLTPFSREEKYYCFENRNNKAFNEVERARMFVVVIRQGFYGKEIKTWAGVTEGDKNMLAFANLTNNLLSFHERIKNIEVTNYSFEQCIQENNNEHTFIYCDPPYVMETRIDKGKQHYKHEFTTKQHEQLLKLCNEFKGLCMISGYDSNLYNEALKGWNKVETTKLQASKLGKNKEVGAEKHYAKEVIWTNYNQNTLF